MNQRDAVVECPGCGSDRVVERVYGLPGPELWAASEAGDVSLGGCLVGLDDPPLGCSGCGAGVWPDGRFRRSASDPSVQSVTLCESGGPVHSRLEASVDPFGELVISGENSGKDVAALLGEQTVRFTLSVERPFVENVGSALIEELVPDLGEALDWMDRHQVAYTLHRRPAPSELRGMPVPETALELPAEQHPKLVLLLLREGFRSGAVASEARLQSLLEYHGIPVRFELEGRSAGFGGAQ